MNEIILDMQSIFNSDWMVSNMINIMSGRELYFYRLTTKFLSNMITTEIITKKITQTIEYALKLIMEDKYTMFVDILEKRKIEIYGPFITQIIWDLPAYLYENNIMNMRVLYENIGYNENDNVLLDYKYIDDKAIYNIDEQLERIKNWFMYESDTKILLNFDKELHIFSGTISETYPVIFQNSIKIEDGQYKFNINNMFSVMNKIQIDDLTQENDIYCCCDYFQFTKQLSNIYNFKCIYNELDYYVMGSENRAKNILVVFDNKTNIFTLCNQYFQSTKYGRISCKPISVVGYPKINTLYIDIEIPQFDINCYEYNCPFKSIEHFHSCLFLKLGDDKFLTNAIILKYDNKKLFNNYTKILTSDNSHTINGNLLDGCGFYKFPPPPVSKGCIGIDLNVYKKWFNNNFDYGEFTADDPYCEIDSFWN
jgi:hypothetical protein